MNATVISNTDFHQLVVWCWSDDEIKESELVNQLEKAFLIWFKTTTATEELSHFVLLHFCL